MVEVDQRYADCRARPDHDRKTGVTDLNVIEKSLYCHPQRRTCVGKALLWFRCGDWRPLDATFTGNTANFNHGFGFEFENIAGTMSGNGAQGNASEGFIGCDINGNFLNDTSTTNQGGEYKFLLVLRHQISAALYRVVDREMRQINEERPGLHIKSLLREVILSESFVQAN